MSLKGKIVAITRPIEDASDLAKLVHKHNGEPYIAPTIEVSSSKNQKTLATFIDRFLNNPHDFVIFMSKNGVRSVLWTAEKKRLREKLRTALNSTVIVAVGPTTAKELKRFKIRHDAIPNEFSSKGIVDFFRKIDIRDKRICLFRADKITNYLRRQLTILGATVDEVIAYQVSIPKQTSHIRRLIDDIVADKIDIVTFTSSATVRNLFEIAEKYHLSDTLRTALNKRTVVSIGPITTKTLQAFKVPVSVTPPEYTIESMMNALIVHLRSS